jgi:hypothetical protein
MHEDALNIPFLTYSAVRMQCPRQRQRPDVLLRKSRSRPCLLEIQKASKVFQKVYDSRGQRKRLGTPRIATL